MTGRAARMITETLFVGDHSDLPTTVASSVSDAVEIIRSGGRALTDSPETAVEVLIALGLDAATARRRVTWATGGETAAASAVSTDPIDAVSLMVAVLKVPGLTAVLMGPDLLVRVGDDVAPLRLDPHQVEGWTHSEGPTGAPTIELRIRDRGADGGPGRLLLSQGEATWVPR